MILTCVVSAVCDELRRVTGTVKLPVRVAPLATLLLFSIVVHDPLPDSPAKGA